MLNTISKERSLKNRMECYQCFNALISHIQKIIENPQRARCQTPTPSGMISVLQLCDCVPRCVQVCVWVYIFFVWLCDNQNETSRQRRPEKNRQYCSPMCVAATLRPYVWRTGGEEPGEWGCMPSKRPPHPTRCCPSLSFL